MEFPKFKIKKIDNHNYFQHTIEPQFKPSPNFDNTLLSDPISSISSDKTSTSDAKTTIKYDNNSKRYFTQLFDIDIALYKHFIGHRGKYIKHLQSSTYCDIRTNKDTNTFSISIYGNTRDIVTDGSKHILSALRQLNSDNINNRRYTHFLSLPLNTNNTLNSKLKQIENYCCDNKIDKDLFLPNSKFHITILMLRLPNTKYIEIAKRIVNNLPNDLSKKFDITLDKLSIMNDNPTETRVLYAKIADNSILKQLSTYLFNEFRNNNLLDDGTIQEHTNKNHKEEELVFKFHATIMKSSKGHHQHAFDSTAILDKYSDDFNANVTINCLHLSQLNYDKDTGYYIPESICNFS